MVRYKLRTKTVCVCKGASRPDLIFIPAGAILRVLDGSANSTGLVEVEWEGNNVQIFSADLRDRGELIKARSA